MRSLIISFIIITVSLLASCTTQRGVANPPYGKAKTVWCDFDKHQRR
jgi:hypothetical protein